MSEPWDVVVVGGGPAGSTAARAAALAGARTLLLDRAEFPRYKTCGGGLTAVSLAALPPDVTPPVAASPSTAVFTHDGRREIRRGAANPLLRMTNRAEFDAALVASAVRAGAELRTGALVRSVRRDGTAGVVLALSGGETVRGLAVVGADGTGGVCGRHVGAEFGQVDVGLEVEVRTPVVQRARWRDALLIDWGPLPGSYGWVFPKGDVLTVGVIGDRATGGALRDYLRSLVARLGLAHAEVLVDSGHLTRCRTAGSALARDGVFLAGDAAGLLEPWTREGISFALRSGPLAGTAAAAAASAAASAAAGSEPAAVVEVSRRYAAEISDGLGREVAAGAAYLAAFARRPGVMHAVAGTPPGWAVFRRIVAGESSLDRLSGRRVVRGGLRVLAR